MHKLALPTAALLAVLAVTACEPEEAADSTETAAVEEPTAEEPVEETEDDAPEAGWDSEQAIADIRTSLEEGAFPELADVGLQASDDEPGHVTVVTAEDTPLLGDVGAIVGDTCEDVPELESVTVDHSGHGGQVIGPVDARCQD